MNNKPKLDKEAMSRLYDFGALLVYEVRYLDVLTFIVKTKLRTFSEELAKEECSFLNKQKINADIFSYYIKFDGAFAKK